MARAISYSVFSSNGSYLRWSDDPSIGFTIHEYQMSITGGGGVDRLYVGAGTKVDAGALFASANTDELYLSGNFSDYTQTISTGGVYTFTGVAGGSHANEVVSFSMNSNGDKLVFANGHITVKSSDYLTVAGSYSSILAGSLTLVAQTDPTIGAQAGNKPAKVFVFDAGGINIPQLPIVNEAIAVSGGGGVDKFYVRKGTNADATGLFASAGIDTLYLTGKFTDYTQTVSASGVYTFTRNFTAAADVGLSEVVSFSMNSSGDKLVFADGGVTLQLANYLSGGAFAPILSSSLGPSLAGAEYANITNMDVRSNLVLVASENIQSAVANKFIRIVDDGGGYRGEAVNNTLTIAANSSMVNISGNKVIINPDVDLDLASNYHIEIDDGAFIGSSGRVLSWITRGGFSTVTPSTSATGAQAVRMNSAGTIENSSLWLDLEGRGDPAQALAAANTFNANNASYVFYVADSDPTTPTNSGSGVKTNSAFNVSIVGLGSDDQVYFDNLGVNQSINQASNISLANNRLTLSSLFSNGGQISFSLAGAALPAAALALPAPEAVASIPANAIPPSTVIDLNSLLGANVVFAESAPVLPLVSALRMTVAGSTSAMQTTNQNTAIGVRGQALQATQVQLFSDANENGFFDAGEAIGALINVDSSGSWSTTINLPEGKNNLRARVLYATAPTQISPLSAVVVDTTPPVPSIALAVDAGANASDGITNNPAIALFGLESGTTWAYQVDGASWLSGTGQQLNAQNSTHTYRVRYTDVAGNSATSNALTVTLDTTAPATPTISGNGISASTISVAGLEANVAYQYNVDGGAWLAGTGSNIAASLGSHSYQVRQTDLAGNTSSLGISASILYLPAPTLSTGNNSLNFGNMVPGASWQYSMDGGAWTNGSGVRLALSNGQHSYQVRQMFSGSTSAASASLSATADYVAPTVTSVELRRYNDGATSGTLSTDGDAVEVKVTFSESFWVSSDTKFTLNIGGAKKAARWSGDNSNALFYYRLKRGDNGNISFDSDALFIPSYGLSDDAGNKLSTTLPSLAAGNTLSCTDSATDATQPTIASMAWRNDLATRLVAGSVVTVAVLMSETVNVTGTPTLAMDVGGSRVQASYSSGSGGNVLNFTYAIQAGQSDSDGISVPVNGFSLNGGSIRDAANNNADLTFDDSLTQWVLRQGPLVGSVTAAAPILYLQEDNGVSGNDRVTSLSSVYISTTQTNIDYFEYRVDGGSWITRYGWGDFPLTLGMHNYEARTKFLDGTYSAISTPVQFTLTDGTVPQPHIRLKTLREGVDGYSGEYGVHYIGVGFSAGDMNGDGLDDAVIVQSDKIYVAFGQAQGRNLDLRALEAGVGGFVIRRDPTQYQYLFNMQPPVASVGDMNGDGLADIALNVDAGYQRDGVQRERVYIIYGKKDGNPIQLGQLLSQGQGSLIQSSRDTSSEDILFSAGDVNADGRSDLGVVNRGVLYVVFGGGNTLTNLDSVGAGIGGYKIYSTAQYQSMTNARAVGDFNGDDHEDFALTQKSWALINGAPTPYIYKTYLVYGKADNNAVVLENVVQNQGGYAWAPDNTYVGLRVFAGGDINGDGLADLVLGKQVDTSNNNVAGECYVVFGRSSNSGMPDLSAIANGTGGFVIRGDLRVYSQGLNGGGNQDNIGYQVSMAGDVNGDGLADLLVSASDANGEANWSGRVYVVYGQTTGSAVDLRNVANGTGGFVVLGATARENVRALSPGPNDLNGDGLADMLLSGNNTSYALYGRSSILQGTVVTSNQGQALGSSASEFILGSAGADVLLGGGGVDRFSAGAGDDVVVLLPSDVANLASTAVSAIKASVDGGNGLDTLRLSQGANLDLTAIPDAGTEAAGIQNRINSIEVIDLFTDGMANTLTLSDADILHMASMNSFNTSNGWSNSGAGTALSTITSYHQLLVKGGVNDQVILHGFLPYSGQTVSYGDNSYRVYSGYGSAAQLLVDVRTPVSNLSQTTVAQVVGVNVVGATGQIGDTLNAGDVGIIGVNYSETVTVRGQPELLLSIGGNQAVATYTSGSGSNKLLFAYTVQAGDFDADGLSVTGLRGGQINGLSSEASTLFPGLGNQSAYKVDTRSVELRDIYNGLGGGFAVKGTTTFKVAALGDVNGDGWQDMAAIDNTKVYVVYGKTNTLAIDVSSGALGSQGFVIQSSNAISALADLGDINGDGLADLVIGCEGDNQTGQVYVVFGRTSQSTVQLSSVANGTGGFVIRGQSSGNQAGSTVAGVGDVNGDGVADILIGAPGVLDNDNNNIGRSYLVYGKSDGTAVNLADVSNGSGGFAINGELTITLSNGFTTRGSAYLGQQISALGDVNGDGLADVVVSGKPSYDWANQTYFNRKSFVVFGKTNSSATNLNTLNNGVGGYVIHSNELNGDIVGIGDANGDGLGDVFVTAKLPGDGTAGTPIGYIVFGKKDSTAVDTTQLGLASSKAIAVYAQTSGRPIQVNISRVGDVNGDGYADFLIGNDGTSYLIYGGTLSTPIQLDNVVQGQGGYAIKESYQNYRSTNAVSGGGDINGDGFDDLLMVGSLDAVKKNVYTIFGGPRPSATVSLWVQGQGVVQGTGADEIISGSTSSDTLSGGGGVDRFFAGAGDDVIVLQASDVSNLSLNSGAALAVVDGGTGNDTLRLTGGASLSLLNVSNTALGTPGASSRVASIERIDLATDTQSNSLVLSVKDVQDIADINSWNSGNGWSLGASVQKHQLVIDGSNNDTVSLVGSWNSAGTATRTLNGAMQNYNVYNSTTGNAQLLIQSAISAATVSAVVESVGIESAQGKTNNWLNAGDTITMAVNFSEAVQVTGSPLLSLNVGTQTVQASYQAGSGTSKLTFVYTILAGQTDDNGISITQNAVQLNGGATIRTVSNRALSLTNVQTIDFADYKVDTTAPLAPVQEITDSAPWTGPNAVSGQSDGLTKYNYVNISVASLEADSTVQYRLNGGAWTNVPRTSIAAGFPLLSGDGVYVVECRQVDVAGNIGAVSSKTVTLDTTAPTISLDNGKIAGNDLITINNRTITGTSEANALINIVMRTSWDYLLPFSRQIAADASGRWSYTLTVDDMAMIGQNFPGQYLSDIFMFQATDLAGNSSQNIIRGVGIDNRQTVSSPTFNAVTGDNLINYTEAANGVVLSGTNVAGATVYLNFGNGYYQQITPVGTNWTYNLSSSSIAALGTGAEMNAYQVLNGNGSSKSYNYVSIQPTAPLGPPTVSIGDASAIEGNALVFPLNLSHPVNRDVTVTFFTKPGTASASASEGDYYRYNVAGLSPGWSRTVIRAGESAGEIRIPTYTDALREGNDGRDTMFVQLDSVDYGTIIRRVGAGTIYDPGTPIIINVPPPPVISIGNGGTINNVNNAVVTGTGTPGGTVSVDFGQFTKTTTTSNTGTFNVALNASEVQQLDQGQQVVSATQTVSGQTSTSTAQGYGVSTLALPSLSISALDADKAEGDYGNRSFTFLIKCTGASSSKVSVEWSTWKGTASQAQGDYIAPLSGVVEFFPNSPSITIAKVITVEVVGNLIPENDKSFQIKISNPVGATIATSTAQAWIRNDDFALDSVLNNPVFRKHNMFLSMADFALQAYEDGIPQGPPNQGGWGWNGINISVDGYSPNSGFYRNGQAEALVGTSNQFLVIAFRGTDGLKSIFTDLHWETGFPNYYQLLMPLVDAVNAYVSANNTRKVYVTGHSLGAAMVTRFMQDHPDTDVTHYEAVTFANPGYISDVDPSGSDRGTIEDAYSRVTNFLLTTDTLVNLPNHGGADLDGYTNMIDLLGTAPPAAPSSLTLNTHSIHNYRLYMQFMYDQGVPATLIADDGISASSDYHRIYFKAYNGVLGVGNDTLDPVQIHPELKNINLLILGGAGNDTIVGGSGDDWINGGTDKDKLTGNGGEDIFTFNTLNSASIDDSRIDEIFDFTHGVDKIWLEKTAFSTLPSSITAQNFVQGNQANDANDFLIYDIFASPQYRCLWYDPDGTGSARQIPIAKFMNFANLDFSDITVYSVMPV